MAAYGVVSQPYGVDDSSLVSLAMELHFDDADPFSLDRQLLRKTSALHWAP